MMDGNGPKKKRKRHIRLNGEKEKKGRGRKARFFKKKPFTRASVALHSANNKNTRRRDRLRSFYVLRFFGVVVRLEFL